MMQIFQIYGTERSGSTLLENFLVSNTEESASLGEVMFFALPFKAEHFGATCACNDINCKFIEAKKKWVKGFKFVSEVKNLFDSSKNIYWHHRVSAANSPDAKIFRILILKRPKDFIHSKLKRGEKNYFLKYVMYNLVVAFTCNIDIVLSLDDLIKSPVDIMEKVHKLSGVSKSFDAASDCNGHHFFGSNTIKKKGIEPVEQEDPIVINASYFRIKLIAMEFVYSLVIKFGGNGVNNKLLQGMFGLLFWKNVTK